jgi:hypothetical protein
MVIWANFYTKLMHLKVTVKKRKEKEKMILMKRRY